MNDREITETIATRVMGWERTEFNNWYTEQGNPRSEVVGQRNFTPLTSDADCMMAWDKLGETQLVLIYKASSGNWLASSDGGGTHTPQKDRRRAMCLCMVKAVTT